MFLIKYHYSIPLDSFRDQTFEKATKFHRIEFHGGVAYCYRSRLAMQALTEDEVDEIEDLEHPEAYIDVPDSFKAGELAYVLPF